MDNIKTYLIVQDQELDVTSNNRASYIAIDVGDDATKESLWLIYKNAKASFKK